jgi:hypothetical protein
LAVDFLGRDDAVSQCCFSLISKNISVRHNYICAQKLAMRRMPRTFHLQGARLLFTCSQWSHRPKTSHVFHFGNAVGWSPARDPCNYAEMARYFLHPSGALAFVSASQSHGRVRIPLFLIVDHCSVFGYSKRTFFIPAQFCQNPSTLAVNERINLISNCLNRTRQVAHLAHTNKNQSPSQKNKGDIPSVLSGWSGGLKEHCDNQSDHASPPAHTLAQPNFSRFQM